MNSSKKILEDFRIPVVKTGRVEKNVAGNGAFIDDDFVVNHDHEAPDLPLVICDGDFVTGPLL
jgi:hypothetical protein